MSPFQVGQTHWKKLSLPTWETYHDSCHYSQFSNGCDWHLHLLEFQSAQSDHRWPIENVLRRGKMVGADFYENGLSGGDDQVMYNGMDRDNLRWGRTDMPPIPD